jgi:hypothetical protein
VEHGLVLSEVRRDPGPTDSLFDVIAAAVAALAPGPRPRVLVLGFAAGGFVAPLRAMGFLHPLEAVDLSRAGERIFRDVARGGMGDVRVHEADAVAWLARTRRRFDLVVEDLSVASGRTVVKPPASLAVLPDLVRRRLRPGGVAVTNVLPAPGLAWDDLLGRIAAPWRSAQVASLEDYENRFLLAGSLPGPAATSRALRRALAAIGSDQAGKVVVRRLAAGTGRR